VEAQKVAMEKTVGAGQKIDAALTLVRIGFFFGDNALVTLNLTKAEECVYFAFAHDFPFIVLNALS
jgi:26S proteasome regulatory subunit N7